MSANKIVFPTTNISGLLLQMRAENEEVLRDLAMGCAGMEEIGMAAFSRGGGSEFRPDSNYGQNRMGWSMPRVRCISMVVD